MKEGGWQQNLRSPHRLCIHLEVVFLAHQLSNDEPALLSWYTLMRLEEDFHPLCLPHSIFTQAELEVCLDTGTAKAATKGLSKFSRLLKSSGLSDQHSTNERQTLHCTLVSAGAALFFCQVIETHSLDCRSHPKHSQEKEKM